MAEVYDHVPGVPGTTVSHVLPNGSLKQSKGNQLERVIALHEDVQRALIKEGMAVFQRADFRMKAAQTRHVMRLREELAEALKTGDPNLIKQAQGNLDYYNANKTKVTWGQADIDFHIGLYRQDGNEFFVEVEGDGDRGLEILARSLTG